MCKGKPSGRDAAPPASHLPGAHPPAGPHGAHGAPGADSGRGGPAHHPEPAAAPSAATPAAAPTPSRAPGAPGLVPPHGRGRRSPSAPAAPSQLWVGGGGFRKGRLGARSREYEPGTAGEEPLLLNKEAAAAAAPPGGPSTQPSATPCSSAPCPSPAHSATLPRRAATLPRPHFRAGALPAFRLAAQWRVGGEEESWPLPGSWERKSGALPAGFVTSWGSDNPFHSARGAHWFRGPASRDRARAWLPGGGWGYARLVGWRRNGLEKASGPDQHPQASWAPGPASACRAGFRESLASGGGLAEPTPRLASGPGLRRFRLLRRLPAQRETAFAAVAPAWNNKA